MRRIVLYCAVCCDLTVEREPEQSVKKPNDKDDVVVQSNVGLGLNLAP